MGDMESVTSDVIRKIKNGRDNSFDFLENADDPLLVAKLISSFANTQGGIIIFGVKENGKINGVLPNEIVEDVNMIMLEYQLDNIVLTFRYLKAERHILVLCDVQAGNSKSTVKVKGKPSCFIRINGKSLLANKIISRVWLFNRNSILEINNFDKCIIDVMTTKGINSLSKLYKEFPSRNSDVDLALSKLIFLKHIEIYESENIIKYRLYSAKSLI